MNRPRAKANPKIKGRSIGKREAAEEMVERKVLVCPDGATEELLVHQVDGELGILELTEDWSYVPVRLEPTKLIVNQNQNGGSGRYRPYLELRLPPEIALRTGRRTITVALYQTAEDKKRGYLRTAHVRAIGPENPDFSIYRTMRGDSESLNRTVEDSLYRHHRAHSEGADRQQVDMLGLAGLINALTRERMRQASLPVAA